MKQTWLVLLLPLVTACDLDLTDLDIDCNVDRDFSESIAVGSADLVRIIAETGDLRVEGRPGLNQVRVRGSACAEDRNDLDEVELVLQRSGRSIRILGLVPSGSSVSARLDLVIEVPDYMLLEIDHESGDIAVTDVAGVAIFDDAGDIRLDHITGDVDINDDSGLLRLRDIAGDVYLIDESGEVDIQTVDGGVFVDEDGSGHMLIRDIGDDVFIGEDGSGDITVEDVNGDFTVQIDGSGRITYRNVRGRISVPR